MLVTYRIESTSNWLRLINLSAKRAGERSAGNLHAPFDVAGGVKKVTVQLERPSRRKLGAPDTSVIRRFSSGEAKAIDVVGDLYPLTLGWFGGNGLLYVGSSNDERVDDLLCAVLHPLGDAPGEPGRVHAVPGSGVDGAAGAKHDNGAV